MNSVQFSSVQDGIYALRKAHMRSIGLCRKSLSLSLTHTHTHTQQQQQKSVGQLKEATYFRDDWKSVSVFDEVTLQGRLFQTDGAALANKYRTKHVCVCTGRRQQNGSIHVKFCR